MVVDTDYTAEPMKKAGKAKRKLVEKCIARTRVSPSVPSKEQHQVPWYHSLGSVIHPVVGVVFKTTERPQSR